MEMEYLFVAELYEKIDNLRVSVNVQHSVVLRGLWQDYFSAGRNNFSAKKYVLWSQFYTSVFVRIKQQQKKNATLVSFRGAFRIGFC